MRLLVTAEFPDEDTGYIEEGFDYCLHEGTNLVFSPFRDEVAITDAIPSDIADNLTGIIIEGGAATNVGGSWLGSLNGLGGGKGYWIIIDEIIKLLESEFSIIKVTTIIFSKGNYGIYKILHNRFIFIFFYLLNFFEAYKSLLLKLKLGLNTVILTKLRK